MTTWREAYAEYSAARQMVEDAGGFLQAPPELVEVERSLRQEAMRLVASAMFLELDAKGRQN